jgi:hypothetical protein
VACVGTDCDDLNATVRPGVFEVCNHIDDNCDGRVDEGNGPIRYYVDADRDGYGDPKMPLPSSVCTTPVGVPNGTGG